MERPGSGSARRATVATPSTLVTTPTRSCAKVEDASSRAAAPVSSRAAMTRFTRLIRSPLPSRRLTSGSVFGTRGKVQMEQGKCHAIPDFQKNKTERFF
jgi:hypothetical protein